MLYHDDLHAILKLRFLLNLVVGKARAVSYSQMGKIDINRHFSLVVPPNELRAGKISVQVTYRRKPQLLKNAIIYIQLQKCRRC